MAVGYPQGRADIDQRAGTLTASLRNLFDEIDRFETFLLATPDVDLEAPAIGYTSQEVAVLKSAFGDLSQLGRIYRGQEDLDTAKDFRTFAKLLTGVL